MTTATKQQVERQQLMDEAVTMAQHQPEAALDIFCSLADDVSFPNRQAAREQAAILYWGFGRYEEAQKQYQSLMEELDKPEQAYFRARTIVRLAEIQIGPTSKGKLDRQQEKQLEEAERIFELNGDIYNVGKVSQIKSAISARRGDFAKAGEQARRGRRLTRVHGQQGVIETALTGVGIPTYAGSSN